MNKYQSDNRRSSRNRTIRLSNEYLEKYRKNLVIGSRVPELNSICNTTIWGDVFQVIPLMPDGIVDLLIIDPPYNLNKNFGISQFKKKDVDCYTDWVYSWMKLLPRILKPNASIYICCDWNSSFSIFTVGSMFFKVKNRITWEREKGRGAKSNWKNCSEDIWFFVNGNKFTFNGDSVKLKRQVIAPYKNNGKPKGWIQENDGNFRLTAPSNLWTDITIPFWSMPENTDHPTQKPEKLIAKLILASSNEGNVVFDPFLGSGTTSVVCKKLNRRYIGVEIDENYCLLTEKRLEMADADPSIQGLRDGVFWERNTLASQKKNRTRMKNEGSNSPLGLFEKAKQA